MSNEGRTFPLPPKDATWDSWLAARPDAHLLQTSGWRRLKMQFGWEGETVAVGGQPGAPLAGASLLFRRSLGLTMAYVPRGPLTDWHDRSLTLGLLDAMRATSRQSGAAFLKIEPELPDTPANRALLHSYGFTQSPQTVQPPSTIVLDLTGDEETILQSMKSKWRYNVRLAERKGVTVRPMTRADLPAFAELMAVTGQRDGFGIHSPDYFATAFDLLTPTWAHFLLAEFEQQPLAAIVVAAAGATACYLWGASSDRERSRMPNHALQWAGMRWAKARGAIRYDFWGIPDELGRLAAAMRGGDGSGMPSDALPLDLEALPHTDLWGVYRFKQGFGGQIVRAVGAWDLPVNLISYRIYTSGLTAQRWLREAQTLAQRRFDAEAAAAPPAATPKAVRLQTITTAANWRTTLASLPEPHVLQSWEWGQVKGQVEWHAERVAVQSPAGAAAFQLLWRQPVPGAPLRVAYIPKGPVMDWANLDLVDAVLGEVETLARRRGCLFVKIDPDVRDDTTAGRLVLHALERRGWLFSHDQIQFQNTACSDLTPGEAALFTQMKNKWRYNVRLAEKRGLCVRQGSEADLATFYALYADTSARDGFLIRPYPYYLATWQTFLRAQIDADNPAGGVLLLAEHPEDSLPVAGVFLLRYANRAWYFYGASSERHRRDMPNHLLQWEAMRWALAQGCTVYDWWGAPSHLDDPEDGMQGVWQFKQGFGAEFQPHIGAWDFPVSPLLYRLYTQAMPSVLDVMRRRHQAQASAS